MRLGWEALAMFLTALACLAGPAASIECDPHAGGVSFLMPVEEFATAYRGVFAMSDGSFVDPSENMHMRNAFLRMLQRMEAVGVEHDATVPDFYNVTICRQHVARTLMLSVLGNFVSKPQDSEELPQLSYTGSLATVVVDRSGDLVVVDTFDNMRKFYLESLLLLSVLAIARLSVARKLQGSQPATPANGAAAMYKIQF